MTEPRITPQVQADSPYIHPGDTIVLTPEWEATCEWFARALREHAFEKNAREPIISFIEQVRYLALTDPEALERIMERLK